MVPSLSFEVETRTRVVEKKSQHGSRKECAMAQYAWIRLSYILRKSESPFYNLWNLASSCDGNPIQRMNEFREAIIADLRFSTLVNTSVKPRKDGEGGWVAELPNLSFRTSAARTRSDLIFIQLSTSLLDIRNCFSDPRVPATASWSTIFGIHDSFSKGREVNDGESGIKLLQPSLDDHQTGCLKGASKTDSFTGNEEMGGMTTRLEQFGE